MDFESQLKEIAQLPTESFVSLFAKLADLGVTSMEDAKYIREEDLSGVLKPIPARRLVEKLRSSGKKFISQLTPMHYSPFDKHEK